MRICVMVDAWIPEHMGGGEKVIWEVMRRLVVNYDCEVDLLVGSHLDTQGIESPRIEEHLDGKLRVLRIGPCFPSRGILSELTYCLLSIPCAARGSYDLIHVQGFVSPIAGWIVGRLTGTPVISAVHGIGIGAMDVLFKKRWVARLHAYLETLMFFRVKYDHQISVSRDIFDYDNVNENITIIPNGVDVEGFDTIHCEKAPEFQLLFVGRFHPQKGLPYLIDAVAEVVQKHSDIRVVLVGSGAEEQTLRARIAELRLGRSFTLTGNLRGEEKIRAFKSSHLFVLPSVAEGQPLTLLESWAAQLPVLLTSVGANPDFVQDGVNGYLVPPRRPDLLADAIIRAMENPDLACLGVRGYEIVREDYSWDRVAERTYQVYSSVLK
ncbi:glycosyltransferase family 4 protein [Chloroflexota bacterium]